MEIYTNSRSNIRNCLQEKNPRIVGRHSSAIRRVNYDPLDKQSSETAIRSHDTPRNLQFMQNHCSPPSSPLVVFRRMRLMERDRARIIAHRREVKRADKNEGADHPGGGTTTRRDTHHIKQDAKWPSRSKKGANRADARGRSRARACELRVYSVSERENLTRARQRDRRASGRMLPVLPLSLLSLKIGNSPGALGLVPSMLSLPATRRSLCHP